MALETRNMGFKFGYITLNDDGTYKEGTEDKLKGVWNTETNAWETPPQVTPTGKFYTLQQMKNFVAGLQEGPPSPQAAEYFEALNSVKRSE